MTDDELFKRILADLNQRAVNEGGGYKVVNFGASIYELLRSRVAEIVDWDEVGLRIKWLSGGDLEQYDVFRLSGEHVAYIRMRFGEFEVYDAECDHLIMEGAPRDTDRGFVDGHSRGIWMRKARRAIVNYLETQA